MRPRSFFAAFVLLVSFLTKTFLISGAVCCWNTQTDSINWSRRPLGRICDELRVVGLFLRR